MTDDPAVPAAPTGQALEVVFRHAGTGRLAVIPAEVPPADTRAAWRRQATGRAGVRLVVTP